MEFKIKTKRDTMGQYNVYTSFVECIENGEVVWEVEVIKDMLHKQDAIEIAKKEIEHIKSINKI